MGEKREHILKCLPPYFSAIRSGEKAFEVRRDDRGYQKGDVLVLREWSPTFNSACSFGIGFTGNQECREISWILTGGQYGVEPGYVVLALKPTPTTNAGGGEWAGAVCGGGNALSVYCRRNAHLPSVPQSLDRQ